MLRDKNLVPLSRQHHNALALCVRILRAIESGEVDLKAWQGEIRQEFEQEVSSHFEAEESVLFVEAARFQELQPLVRTLLGQHSVLRGYFSKAANGDLTAGDLKVFAEILSSHIRTEERDLFESCQRLMAAAQLASLGGKLNDALESLEGRQCSIPSPATRLRPKRRP
ncbi:MAG TPA: hemerythrin domain-containing protein [Terriglobales bacterium]|nr:hemerythrin domain-containing protein [Terriglobales bacterium]